jgi:hypothetical protein
MRWSRSFVLLVAITLPLALGQDPPRANPWTAVQQAAQRGLDETLTSSTHGTIGPEEVARWSLRVVDAGVSAGGDAAALRREHVERMEKLADDTRRRREVGAASTLDVATAEYHLAHARALAR